MVEDEPLVRMIAVEILRERGFQVVEAEDAEEALRLLEADPRISAVFSDVNMPGPMDGIELARQVRARRPDVGVVLTSGRFQPGPASARIEGAQVVAKPYAADAVADLIGELVRA